MAFVRRRGNSHTLIDAYRVGDKVRQRIIANLGPYASVKAAIKADPEKFGHLAQPVVSPVVSAFERRVQAEVEKCLAAMSQRLEAAENEARRLRRENDRLRAQKAQKRKKKQRGET